jgi:DNA-binding transcriptional MerR regulator
MVRPEHRTETGLEQRYKIRDFARLAGVTVRALHVYDRMGLLTPVRTSAGYRVYTDRDLEALEHIVALKFLGIPLKAIAAVLQRPALTLPDALRVQREALEEKQASIGRAIRVIRTAEEAIHRGKPADPAMLKAIIEVIGMHDELAMMKKYYSDEAWEQHRRYYEEGPSAEWRAFYHDARQLLQQDPACEAAQALIPRWLRLAERAQHGDPDALNVPPEAWIDRQNWPPAMKDRAAEFQMEEVHQFMKQVLVARARPGFTEEGWAALKKLQTMPGEQHSAQWQARVDLFRDLEAAATEDPAGPKAQALVARWRHQIDQNTGGNAEVKAALLAGWSQRRAWPESQRWQVERLHMMSFDRFEKAADFLDRAIAASEPSASDVNSV